MKENPFCLAFNASSMALLLPFALPETWAGGIGACSVLCISAIVPLHHLGSKVNGFSNPCRSVIFMLGGLFLGLLLASLVIIFSPSMNSRTALAPGPCTQGVLEGVLDQDARIRTRQGRTWYELSMADWKWTDSQGRHFTGAKGGGPIRIPLLEPSEGVKDPPGFADPARLAFAGDRVRVSMEFKADGKIPAHTRLLDMVPPEGLQGLRARALEGLISSMKGLDSRTAGLVLALLLGRQDFIAPEDQEIFMKTGCVHLIALSGMHVTMVLGLGMGIFSWFLGGPKGRVAGLVMVCILLWLVGPFPSAIRALLMCLWAGIARIAGYPVDQREALGLAGFSLLLLQPSMLGQLGYQLSAWTLYGMMFFQAPLDRRLRTLIKPVPSARLSPGIAAQLASMPLLVANGLSWYPQGILASLVLEPLCLVLMVLGLLQIFLTGASVLPFPGNPALFLDREILIPLTEAVFRLARAWGGLFVWFP